MTPVAYMITNTLKYLNPSMIKGIIAVNTHSESITNLLIIEVVYNYGNFFIGIPANKDYISIKIAKEEFESSHINQV